MWTNIVISPLFLTYTWHNTQSPKNIGLDSSLSMDSHCLERTITIRTRWITSPYLRLDHWIMQFRSFHWLSHQGLWAILPCSTKCQAYSCMILGIFISAFVLLLIQWNLRLRRPLAIVSDQLYSATSFPKYQKFPEVKSLYFGRFRQNILSRKPPIGKN